MAEQTFRSPGFFEQEIDLSARKVAPTGTPAGVVGTSERGPAFVPVTVGSFADFETKFGGLDTNRFGPYAVREFLKHRTALTYMRVLGAGANETAADIDTTLNQGSVKNAGVNFRGQKATGGVQGRYDGVVQILVAAHTPSAEESVGFPVFTDNDSFFSTRGQSDTVNVVRAVLMTPSGTSLQLMDAVTPGGWTPTAFSDQVNLMAISGSALTERKYFKIIVSSSAGASFAKDDGQPGIRVISASLDPADGNYISKVLNTDPLMFQKEQHLLYTDYAVGNDLAPVVSGSKPVVAILSGSGLSVTNGASSQVFRDAFGRFDTRYTTPRTTTFISQPYGFKEFDLFHVESLSDGAYANDKFKVSIANLRASTDPNYKYGTFELQVRAFGDTDTGTEILERYPECTLDPKSERYIARQIGDKKVQYNFDQEVPDERRLVISGKYPNVSQRIRVQMNSEVEGKDIPADALPFGFRGLPCLKTNDMLTDSGITGLTHPNGTTLGSGGSRRMTGIFDGDIISGKINYALTASILPPLPYRFKVTRGAVSSATSPEWVGETGTNERVDGRFYWGVKGTRTPLTSSLTNAILNTNVSTIANPLIAAYTQFAGIQKMGLLVTGSGKDEFNNNKFTLARVAFYNSDAGTGLAGVFGAFTGSAGEHIKEASYIRSGDPDKTTYTVSDGSRADRYTMASLIQTSSVLFNRFTEYAKFTNIFYGGWDGVNLTDESAFFFKDKSLSSATGGGAVDATPDLGILGSAAGVNPFGKGRLNNGVASLRRAIEIMTDPMSVNINILAVPGARDTFVTDHALERTKKYSQAIYLMDLVKLDEDGNRLYDDSTARVDVRETSENFESRAVDNNYGATFFPDVFINDQENNQIVKVPASVAALATLGFNDKVAFPWFAPAGFNRGALDFVTNVETRLSSGDRDTLYDARINPIAVFPRAGFVIFGQKTLQMKKSALDRVNVRRMMLEVKRQIVRVANKILFEPNNAQTRARFVSQVTPLLALIQAQAGIEQFKVVCDDTNNSVRDVEENKLNGRIVVVPTRAIEFIAIDFIVTNSGVSFE